MKATNRRNWIFATNRHVSNLKRLRFISSRILSRLSCISNGTRRKPPSLLWQTISKRIILYSQKERENFTTLMFCEMPCICILYACNEQLLISYYYCITVYQKRTENILRIRVVSCRYYETNAKLYANFVKITDRCIPHFLSMEYLISIWDN